MNWRYLWLFCAAHLHKVSSPLSQIKEIHNESWLSSSMNLSFQWSEDLSHEWFPRPMAFISWKCHHCLGRVSFQIHSPKPVAGGSFSWNHYSFLYAKVYQLIRTEEMAWMLSRADSDLSALQGWFSCFKSVQKSSFERFPILFIVPEICPWITADLYK